MFFSSVVQLLHQTDESCVHIAVGGSLYSLLYASLGTRYYRCAPNGAISSIPDIQICCLRVATPFPVQLP